MDKKNKIKIKLNGKLIAIEKGINLGNLVSKLKYPLNKIAIEKNVVLRVSRLPKKVWFKSAFSRL